MFYWACKSFCELVLKVLFRCKVSGIQHVPKKGGFILACNHISFLDPVVAGGCCPRAVHYMARDTLFKNFFFGALISHLNTFPVKRGSADIGALREAIRRVRDGDGLLVFPEGTRNAAQDLGQTKQGVGFLATKLGVPVVPAFIKGTEKALPKGKRGMRLCRIEVRYGQAIRIPRDMNREDAAALVMGAIRKLSLN